MASSRTVEHARGAYAVLRLVAVLIPAALYVVVLASARGERIQSSFLFLVLMGGLLVLIGSVLGKVRPNWFVGIRTPWTLSSKRAWTQTHRAGGRLFIVMGLVILATGFVGPQFHAVLPLLVGMTGSALIGLVVYSYLVWRSDPAKLPPVGTLPAERR